MLHVVLSSLVLSRNDGNSSSQRTSVTIMNNMLLSEDNQVLGVGGIIFVVSESGLQITIAVECSRIRL